MDLGIFSISLAVKDIATSKSFYEKLGFKPVAGAGSVADKWLILKKDAIKIGLFQDLFPHNTLTFNPTDARSIYKVVEEHKIPVLYSAGLDQERGPCSFSFLDPDGNPILFDQHQ